MTTIHAHMIGDQAVVPRQELERLLELARRCEPVELELDEGDVSTLDVMRLADTGGSFDFWLEEGEDIYTAQDGEAL
ncbi:MAG TPA: hypothetical protein DDY78_23280 [Planctomycetales bacterium]|jgi:hypothetical protein|nr:hypothetical protein [Planctomycetales bacterium]